MTITNVTIDRDTPSDPPPIAWPSTLRSDDWPSPTQTWLRYFYIGRWNYLKGLAVASIIAAILFFTWSKTAASVVLICALLYVAISGFGLYLLYGPPSRRIFRKLFAIADLQGDESILDLHFGTWRVSRQALELLPEASVHSVGIHDAEGESEAAVRDVWKFERPPHHPRVSCEHGRPDSLPLSDNAVDVVIMGFGIHEVHAGPERTTLMDEIKRVLRPHGKVLLVERGWSPLLLFVFGPLFLHFTPAKEWEAWLRNDFMNVHRDSQYRLVDIFVASNPN